VRSSMLSIGLTILAGLGVSAAAHGADAERALIDVTEDFAGDGCDVEAPDRGPGARLAFTEARVRQPIPGQDKTVAYFTVSNQGSRPVSLVAARAEGVGAIELHTTVRDGDMVRMRRLREVSVAPGESVVFEPGGRHLMLFRVTELPPTLLVELDTAEGETLTVPFLRFALSF
jgi:copper(I)-binding protein